MLSTIDRYWHTLAPLKPQQIIGRLVFRLVKPTPDLSAAPMVRVPAKQQASPAQRAQSLFSATTVNFLNVDGDIDTLGWDNEALPKLWRYNLHYFDDLCADSAQARRVWHSALIARWIAENPPARGSGWEPYPLSLRVVNWTKASAQGLPLNAQAIHSLAVQARFLRRRLEHHLLGNHLFANAKALIHCGWFFAGAEAEAWRLHGTEILLRELEEQFLPDGAQFELSPMYHALAVEDVLDLIAVAEAHRPSWSPLDARLDVRLRAIAPKLLSWLAFMSHPDDGIAFFNDCAFGVAPTNAALRAYAARLNLTAETASPAPCVLTESGYARAAVGEALLISDLAEVGPSYLPGHAHADTLSFELSFGGDRLIVNSGTSEYGLSKERLRQRGTAAHSTVTVDGRNSSDVWSGFRVGRRAKPLHAQIEHTESSVHITGAHNGYTNLRGAPLHWRKWALSPQACIVEDSLSAQNLQAQARFHFHPSVHLDHTDQGCGRAHLPGGRVVAWDTHGADMNLEQSTYHPEFGVSVSNTVLAVALTNGKSRVSFRW